MSASTESVGSAPQGSPGLRASNAARWLLAHLFARTRRAGVVVGHYTYYTLRAFPREMGRVTVYLICFSAFVGVTVELFGPWVALVLVMSGRPAWDQIRQRRGPAWWVWDRVRWHRERG
jgi:hypothetical protein